MTTTTSVDEELTFPSDMNVYSLANMLLISDFNAMSHQDVDNHDSSQLSSLYYLELK